MADDAGTPRLSDEQEAERIVREHDLICAGVWADGEPYWSAAPNGYPLCAACAALRDRIAAALRAARRDPPPETEAGE